MGRENQNVIPVGSDLLMVGDIAHIAAAVDIDLKKIMGMEAFRKISCIIADIPLGKQDVPADVVVGPSVDIAVLQEPRLTGAGNGAVIEFSIDMIEQIVFHNTTSAVLYRN